MPPKIPPPTVYLRNKFLIKPGLTGQFFEGQKNLLQRTRAWVDPNAPSREAAGSIDLLAACGTQPLLSHDPIPEKLPQMMHIWRLPRWDSLYNLMYTFTESDWYASEVSSLQVEHQDLLVGIGCGVELEPRPETWMDESPPGYVYLYDEIRINMSVTKLTHLRDLNWFACQVREDGWHLAWLAAEVTGTPSQICLLWRVPSVDIIGKTMQRIATSAATKQRYAKMMLNVQQLSRRYMYPESTESIDNVLAAGGG